MAVIIGTVLAYNLNEDDATPFRLTGRKQINYTYEVEKIIH